MRVQNHIPIKAVAVKEEDGLEIGTEYDVEDIMMGQSNTSVRLVGMKDHLIVSHSNSCTMAERLIFSEAL